MKHGKLVGLLVAGFGMVASFAAASALYLRTGDDLQFGIGATYHGKTGRITYTINNKTEGSVAPKYCTDSLHGDKEDGAGLGGNYTQLKYEFLLGANFTPQTLHQQRYVMGKFSIDIDQVNENFDGVGDNGFKVWVQTQGYEIDNKYTLGERYYKYWNNDQDYSLSQKEIHVAQDIAVESSGVQKVVVYVKFAAADVNEAALLDLNEASIFRFKATWEQPSSSYIPAYIVGTMNSWTEDDAYAMTPNIEYEYNEDQGRTWEWVYTNLQEDKINNENVSIKGKITMHPEAESVQDKDIRWSNVDTEINSNQTYSVYWSGVNGAELYFDPAINLEL